MIQFLTVDDFDNIVSGSDKPVLVDFYAQWCVDPATKITLGDRQSVTAAEVLPGQPILSFNQGLHPDKVAYSRTVADGGHCRKIITASGRSVSTTDDHLFWTSKGWKSAKKLKPGDLTAVYPGIEPLDAGAEPPKTVVSADLVRNSAMAGMRVESYLKELARKQLLPLKTNSQHLPVLSRLMGALFTDGGLYFQKSNNYREVSFVLGDKQDVKTLTADLNSLGFDFHVNRRNNRQQISGRSFTSRTYRVKCLSTALWLLFKALGVPVGNKTNQDYRLPDWLFGAPKLIKREFLAGFLGGDGPKLLMQQSRRRIGNSYNSLTINDLEFYKRSDLAASGVKFGRQLRQLLLDFDIEIRDIFTETVAYQRKDGSQTAAIHLKFRQNFDTGYRLAANLGYAYCARKQKSAMTVGEFLRRVITRRRRWRQLYRRAQQLAGSAGLSPVMVARKLKISASTAWGWLKLGRKPTTPRHFEKFADWIRRASRGLTDGLIWDEVTDVKPVFLPAVQRITVARQHSFVANGFVVHNCGPCKAAAPILDDLSDDYADDLVVAKIDVDDQPELAKRFDVLSIPTVILFNEGEEVDRKIGFGGRSGYEELIKKVITKN